MLTVRYDQLGLQPGDRVLDLGCGFGRHAYEALRRGAHVVACDLGHNELARRTLLEAFLEGAPAGSSLESHARTNELLAAIYDCLDSEAGAGTIPWHTTEGEA